MGSPPTSFQNPWPSFDVSRITPIKVFKTRFARDKPPFVPVPADRQGIPKVLTPDFTATSPGHLKVTWLGHASFLVQCPASSGTRGINILLDPVFSERTSPVSFLGPKRYTPPPCSISELCDTVLVDAVCISHNHYDHADIATLKHVYERRGKEAVFLVGLGNSRWLVSNGIDESCVKELDWWDQLELSQNEKPPSNGPDQTQEQATHKTSSIRITCCPSQHASARSPFDRCCDLWCSFAISLPLEGPKASSIAASHEKTGTAKASKSLFFAGDTGYRALPTSSPSPSELAALPVCPAFTQIGDHLGPFDLSLLPIGLCTPRDFMSSVHCNAADSLCVHKDIKSKKSVGMHWGTVRGGLSAQYEDVRMPGREW